MKKFIVLLVFMFAARALFSQSLGQDGQNDPNASAVTAPEDLPTLKILPFQWVDLTDASKKAKPYEPEGTIFNNASVLDESFDAIQMDMTFTYFGEKYSTATIVTNGFVALGGNGATGSAITQQNISSFFGGASYSPSGIPSPRLPNNIIAPLWIDINFDYSKGYIYYRTFKPETSNKAYDHLVVQWDDAGLFQDFNYGNESVRVSFELVLFAEGGIMFQYKLISAGALRKALLIDQQYGFVDPDIDIDALTDLDLIKSISELTIGYEDETGLKGASWALSVSSGTALGNELVPDWASGTGGSFLDFQDGRDRRNNVTTSSGGGGCFLSHKKASQDR